MRFREPVSASVRFTTIAALLLTAAACSHAQKDDPFDYLRKDERLSAEVTLRCNGEALKDVVDIIEAATAAKVSVDPDISEDKVTIFCRGQPASEVMVQIAKLFGYHFRPQKRADDIHYVLFRDDAARELEHKLKREGIDKAFEKIGKVVAACAREVATQEGYEELWEAIRVSGGLPGRSAEVLGLPEELHPIWRAGGFPRFCLANRGIPLLYSRLSKEQIEKLKDEEKVIFASYEWSGADPLPEDLVPLLCEETDESRVDELFGISRIIMRPESDAEEEPEAEEIGPVVAVRVEFYADIYEFAGSHQVMPWVILAQRDRKGKERYVDISGSRVPIAGPSEDVRKRFALETLAAQVGEEQLDQTDGDPILQTPVKVQGPPAPMWTFDLDSEAPRQMEPAADTAEVTLPVSRTSPAELLRQRDFYTLSDLLEELAPQVPVCLIADHYDKQYVMQTMGRTFGRVITAIQASGHDLTRDGDWFRFRNVAWYMDRPALVPNHFLLRWLRSERKEGALGLADLAGMSLLTKEQLKNVGKPSTTGLCTAFESLRDWTIVESAWDWIKAFAVCTDEQRHRLVKGESVRVSEMPEAARECLKRVLIDFEATNRLGVLPKATFSVSHERQKDRTNIRFDLSWFAVTLTESIELSPAVRTEEDQ